MVDLIFLSIAQLDIGCGDGYMERLRSSRAHGDGPHFFKDAFAGDGHDFPFPWFDSPEGEFL